MKKEKKEMCLLFRKTKRLMKKQEKFGVLDKYKINCRNNKSLFRQKHLEKKMERIFTQKTSHRK